MTDYIYSITYTDKYGRFEKVSCGTEEQMFEIALAVWEEDGNLLSASREVYETANGYAHCVRIEPYRMGKPIEAEAVWL